MTPERSAALRRFGFNTSVAEEAEPSFVYVSRFRLGDGTEKEGTLKEGTFTTRRRRAVGELANFPTDKDGMSRTGKGYVWLIASIEETEDQLVEGVLVLDFKGPHPEMQEPPA